MNQHDKKIVSGQFVINKTRKIQKMKNKTNTMDNYIQKKIMKSINVYYDPQQGSYFKIDKNTGQTKRSHRNGSDFVKFKPDYTGADYRIRKENQKDLSPSSLSRPVFQVNYDHKHTIPVKSPSLKRQPKSQVSITTGIPYSDSNSNLMGYSRIFESKILPPTSDIFTDKLKQYSKIRQGLKKQNHSPRVGYQGCIPTSQKIGGQYKNEIFQGLSEQKKINKNKSTNTMKTLQSSPSIILKNQLLKQREIFLRFNSSFKTQENERQQKQLKERKINLKILQSLFINKNNRQTNLVYS